MQKRLQPSVLLYGNSNSLDVVRKELPGFFGLRVDYVDPAAPGVVQRMVGSEVRLLVYDRGTANLDYVTAFQIKHPTVPVVCLDDQTKPQVEVSFRDNSRIETSGLPQVLQVLEECWSLPAFESAC